LANTDRFQIYPYWNPFIQYIDGDLREVSELNALLHLSEKQYHAEIGILKVINNSELRCCIKKFDRLPGLLKGELKFSITPLTDTNQGSDSNPISRFDLKGSFRGLFVLFHVNETTLKRAFEKMACALKTIAENTNLNPCIYQY
jgi:hypothetical protein